MLPFGLRAELLLGSWKFFPGTKGTNGQELQVLEELTDSLPMSEVFPLAKFQAHPSTPGHVPNAIH